VESLVGRKGPPDNDARSKFRRSSDHKDVGCSPVRHAMRHKTPLSELVMHLVVIGGSDAGISAALRAQELEPGAEISVLVADDYPNFSICGLPYFLSGDTPDWHSLAHRTEFPGLNILRRHLAQRIDARHKAISCVHAGADMTMRYDRLVIATGAKPVRPDLPGSKHEGVFVLHTMDDSFAVHQYLTDRKPRAAALAPQLYYSGQRSTRNRTGRTKACHP
jgi:NAD(P)H-nitrite reductase large subunit